MPKIEPHERLYIWRRHKGATLQQVADAVGKTRQWAFRVELGECDIGMGKLSTICRKALGIDIEKFFGELPPAPAPGRAA